MIGTPRKEIPGKQIAVTLKHFHFPLKREKEGREEGEGAGRQIE